MQILIQSKKAGINVPSLDANTDVKAMDPFATILDSAALDMFKAVYCKIED